MKRLFRKLNDRGVANFKHWLTSGGLGEIPVGLLDSPEDSFFTDYIFSTDLPEFENRYDFGKYLVELLGHIPHLEIENDINFWSSLALLWFDRISSKTDSGDRIIRETARYILKMTWHDYRHLIRTPWLLVRLHNRYSKFLLFSASTGRSSLSVNTDTLEKIASRQTIMRNQKVIKVFSGLYFDEKANQLKPRINRDGPGTPIRTGIIVRQLALTYDLEQMSERAIYDLLPREFNCWKEGEYG